MKQQRRGIFIMKWSYVKQAVLVAIPLIFFVGFRELRSWQPRTIVKTGMHISQILFAPDGRSIIGVCRTSDNFSAFDYGSTQLKRWDVSDGKEIKSWNNMGKVMAVVQSPDGHRLATVDWDTYLHLWKTADGTAVQRLNSSPQDRMRRPGATHHFGFSSDSKTLIRLELLEVGAGELSLGVKKWSSATGQLQNKFTMPTLVADKPSGATLAERWRIFYNTEGSALSPDGSLFATGWQRLYIIDSSSRSVPAPNMPQNQVRVFRTSTGAGQQTLQPKDVLHWLDANISFAPDSSRLLVIAILDGGTHMLQMWDVRSGKELWSYKCGTSAPQVCWSPTGEVVAVAENSKLLTLRDAGTGRIKRKLDTPNSYDAISISPSGTHLAVADGNITLHRIK